MWYKTPSHLKALAVIPEIRQKAMEISVAIEAAAKDATGLV